MLSKFLPSWLRSIRVRLTLLYSVVLFSFAAAMVGGIYLALRSSLNDEPVTRTVRVQQLFTTSDGRILLTEQDMEAKLQDFESLVNTRALDQLRDYSFAALAFLFVGSLIVGWVVSGRVVRPIDRITKVASEIGSSDLSRRIQLAGPDDEIRRMADTFDGMLDRLDEGFAGQRRFIHEASHELRNPLAVMRSNLDVALANPATDVEEFRKTAEVVGHSTERMTRLVDDLLVWARQEQMSLRTEPVDVGAVVRQISSEFQTPAAEKGIKLSAAVEPDLFATGDGAALGRALANLLANAVRVSISGTKIVARAGRETAGASDSVFIEVEDQGPGIAKEHHEAVFQRFWRGNPGEAREQGRSGLGLAIVKQIAEAHGGDVTLESSLGHGAKFTIRIPVAHIGRAT